MKDIETKISPFIESQFPAFYREDGPNFVAFVKAYYEWLEQNHQLLQLEDSTNFNIGDTIQQESVTGTIISYVGTQILVLVDGLETFKCFNVCSELIPVTSSSGGNTYILRGGTARRLGSLFLSRKLPELRDIDRTLDLFIVRFKEKYLKNIEFDVKTNKRLLVKNALDLYRSKGTERSIDLFFRLVYGASSQVYYPGEDLFRLSDGEWVLPKYIEIQCSNTSRAVDLVGKQITGLKSGATAFVERFIKRKIKTGFVYMLYVSNIDGDFEKGELVYHETLYNDSPKIVGSLDKVDIILGSENFKVGDVVTFNSVRGDFGSARVTSIKNTTGLVDFLFLEGGYGYTVSGNTDFTENELKSRTQSIVSEKVLTLSNVVVSNTISSIIVNAGGTGYSNNDKAIVDGRFVDAVGQISTNSTGGIIGVTITNTGSGFYTLNPAVTIQNSTGGSSFGSSASLTAWSKEQDKYFYYFEPLIEQSANVTYGNATNAVALTVGSPVRIGNSSTTLAYGTILNSANSTATTGTLRIIVANNGTVGTGNTIFVLSNSSITANITAVTNTSITSDVMGVPSKVSLTLSGITSANIAVNDVVYQIDNNGVTTSSGVVSLIGYDTASSGSIEIQSFNGVFREDRQLLVQGKNVTANITSTRLTVGVYNILNTFTSLYNSAIYTTTSGTTGIIDSIGQGYGASFRVGSISDTETIRINTDLLSANNKPVSGANQEFMSLPIASLAYGFPKAPLGNSASIITTCLNSDQFEIGTIASLNQINPGADYNVDPYVLAYQPYVAGFDHKDYIINISSATSSFVLGERIDQSAVSVSSFNLTVAEDAGFEIGERVYQTNSTGTAANAVISGIYEANNTIAVSNVVGTFVVSSGSNSSLISFASAQSAIVYTNATNNQQYANASVIKLGTTVNFAGNSTAVTVSNSTITHGWITLGTATSNFANGDVVTYIVPSGNSVIGGLTANTEYNVTNATATTLQLANSTSTIAITDVSNSSFQTHRLVKFNANGKVINNANNTLANANGVMYAKITSGALKVGDRIYLSSNLDISANATSWTNSSVSSAISNSSAVTSSITAKAIVKSANNTVIRAKRTQFENYFQAGQSITGASSGATATIISIEEEQNVLPIGLNATIEANVTIANGAVTSLDIIDSGVGYNENEDIFFLSEDQLRSGTARVTLGGIGTGSGYYKTSKGFLSSISKVHDGDYYQEYSYEILSRIPFDKYKDMFKKVLHTAGTRFFGGVLLEEYANVIPTYVNSAITSGVSAVTINFNGASNVSANTIVFDNDYANSALKIASGNMVKYYRTASNTKIGRLLVNNGIYYANSANATSIKLTTSPSSYSYNFNANSSVVNNYIVLGTHNFLVGDIVQYTTAAGNTVIAGLSNNQSYYVYAANSTAIKISSSTDAAYTSISNSTVVQVGEAWVGPQDTQAFDVSFSNDGTKMYILGGANERIYEYDLSIPWRANTATYNNNSYRVYDATGGQPDIRGGVFSSNGSLMYVTGPQTGAVTQLYLTTPWDITSVNNSVTVETSQVNAIIFTANSTNVDTINDFILYPAANSVIANGTSVIYHSANVIGGLSVASTYVIRYANSTGFKLSSNSTSANIDLTSTGSGTQAFRATGFGNRTVHFSNDGSKMFTLRALGGFVRSFDLATPWNIQTATVNTAANLVITSAGAASGIAFTSDGKNIVVTGSTNTLTSYTLTEPWDINTANLNPGFMDIGSANSVTSSGLFIKNDDTVIYTMSNFRDRVFEHKWNMVVPSNINETGHTISTSVINIQANTTSTGANASGHYITTDI